MTDRQVVFDDFKKIWHTQNERIKNLEIDINQQDEMNRLKKMMLKISSLLEIIDPELSPLNHLNTARDHLISFRNNIDSNSYLDANGQLDEIYINISNGLIGSKSTGKFSHKIFKDIQDTITKFENETAESRNDIKEKREQLEKEQQKIIQKNDEIQTFYDKIFTQDKNIQSEIENYKNLIIQYNSELKALEEEVTKGNADKPALIYTIKEAHKEANTFINEKYNSIKDAYDKIFGTKNKDTGETEGGLEKEIEAKKIEIDQLIENKKMDFNKLKSEKIKDITDFLNEKKDIMNKAEKEIRTQLDGATTAGLAGAFKAQKESYSKGIKNHNITFYLCIVLMFVMLGFNIKYNFSVFESLWAWYYETEIINNADLFKFLQRIFIFVPVLWLALSSSKKASALTRLQQEYAHKEAIARSYLSFKKQIDELKAEDTKLCENLINTAINAVGYNASETLDKKHGDKMPTHEALEKSLEMLGKVIEPLKNLIQK